MVRKQIKECFLIKSPFGNYSDDLGCIRRSYIPEGARIKKEKTKRMEKLTSQIYRLVAELKINAQDHTNIVLDFDLAKLKLLDAKIAAKESFPYDKERCFENANKPGKVAS